MVLAYRLTHPLVSLMRQWPSGTAPAFIAPYGHPQSGRRAFDSRLAYVVAQNICLLVSPARRAFKKMAGQNNHFLITIQVGLAAVENGTAQPPSEMRVSWAPHDRASSAGRSREFANKALLAWLVDAIDAYVRAVGHPPAVANADLKNAIACADNQSAPGSTMARASNVWAKSPERCRSSIIQIALNNGFSIDSGEVPNQLTVSAIDELIHMSPSEAVRELVT